MKKTFLALVLFTLSLNIVKAQGKLNDTDKIATLTKLYGFLKYYHPAVASGERNWDDEFVQKLPLILETSDQASLSKIYLAWIEELGTVEKCDNCNVSGEFFDKNFDLSWTQNDQWFSKALRDKLKYIENNRFQGTNHYVTTQSVGQIKITNEPDYKGYDYPDEAYRLLGMAKYWNIIEYFFPYKHLTDQDWGDVLYTMIPKFRQAANQETYRLTIKELIAKLDDSHARIIFENTPALYSPIRTTNIDNQAVISGFYNDSIAQLNNLQLGDVILKIDGKNVQEEKDRLAKYTAGSNPNAKAERIYNQLLDGKSLKVDLSIQRGQEVLDIIVNRYNAADFKYYDNPNIVKSKTINGDIGYMDMTHIKATDIVDIMDSFKDKKALIIDLRNYPEFIYRYISQNLNSEKRAFMSTYRPVLTYPGRFNMIKNFKTGSSRDAYQGKVIILVNAETVSRAEFTVMAFQTADNAITVGNQTKGADGDVAVFKYLGGYNTLISGNGIEYPDGTPSQRKGVKIDVVVKPTIEGLRKGIDEVLEKAIELASN